MGINYSGPSVPGGEVSPGSGTTAFTSGSIPRANSSGQLTNSLINAGGSTVAFDLSTSPHPNSGSVGPTLTRDTTGRGLGYGYYTGSTFVGDHGLDAATHDYVFWYDAALSGDVLRYSPTHQTLIYSVPAGTPSSNKLVHLVAPTTASGNAPLVTDVLYLQNGQAGSSGVAAIYIRGQNAGTENFSITVGGFGGFGRNYQGHVANGGLESQVGITVRSTAAAAPLVRLRREEGSTIYQWDITGSSVSVDIKEVAGNQTLLSASTARVTVGTSSKDVRLTLPSTIAQSTAVGTSGAAASPPANPETYIKILAPNAAGTLTTLYLPAYLSTA